MIVIGNAQMDQMNRHSMRRFETRLMAHLEEVVPKEYAAAGDQEVLKLIRAGMKRAKPYGIEAEEDIALFVELMLTDSPEWELPEERKWARDILQNRSLTGHLKMAMLYDEISAELPSPENP